MSSITGLGIRNRVTGKAPAKSNDSAPKEGWRSKGMSSVSGVTGKLGIGKAKDSGSDEHISRPLATLKDPAAFGPPPKNVNYHGGAALPNQITPDRSGLGSPIKRDEISAKYAAEREEQQREEEEATRPKPSVPYRTDTTGLSTSHLPPPPGRKDGADGRSPILSSPTSATRAKPPGLPPRLPPRQNSTPISPPPRYTSTQPDTHKGIMNQGALDRLGAAGVVVPGLGIEGRKPPLPPPSSNSPTKVSSEATNQSHQLNELQSRFSRLSPSSSNPDSQSKGTTLAQKQAAFKTASAFRNDPSSVSLSDAREAAGTANNFKERHGDQVKSGWQSANKVNTKYGLTEKLGTYGDSASPQTAHGSSPGNAVLGKKKPPPPPPMKKPSLVAEASGPPPIPLSTKPKPGAYS